MTTIRYFVPEDGDVEEQPNVFLAPKPRSTMTPTLGEVKNAFPLPGKYHFRFKCPLVPGGDRDGGSKSFAVWMDCVNDRQAVPTWRNSIISKVTRMGVEDLDDDDDDDDSDFVRPSQQQQHPQQQQQQQQHQTPAAPVHHHQAPPPPQAAPQQHQQRMQQQQQPSLDIFDGPAVGPSASGASTQSSGAHSSATSPAPPSGGSMNLLDDHHHGPPAPAPAAAAGGSHDFLGMGAPSSTAAPAASHHPHADFLGMTAPAPTTTAAPAPPPAAAATATRSPPVSGNYHPGAAMSSSMGAMPNANANRGPPSRSASGTRNASGGDAFSSFSQQQQQGPFGGLGTPWKT